MGEWQMLRPNEFPEANVRQRNIWALDVSYLFQALHVFEVESNVKKAEIRIYKLKLQEKEISGVIKKSVMWKGIWK